MIIGRGSLASLLIDRADCLLFASGVGNSSCTDEKEYSREKHLLSTLYGSVFSLFYFSSISVNFVESRYTRHKLEMEQAVKDHFPNYNIIRIGNIYECTNPNTFINYLYANPKSPIRDEWKWMIDKKTLNLVTDSLPATGQNEISIFKDMKKVKDCLI